MKLLKKPSALKKEHPALQNMKFHKYFLLSRVIFALLDPDSEYGSGSTDPIESVSATLVMKVRYLLTEAGQLVSCSDVLDDLSVEDVRIREVRAGFSLFR
jgi:hypothetical protein